MSANKIRNAFKKGQEVLVGPERDVWVVEGDLGSGAQGDVYLVSGPSGERALKWYSPEQATADQQERLKVLIAQAAPSETFLWPLALAEVQGVEGFGYVMPVCPIGFVGMGDVTTGKIPISSSKAIRACLNIVAASRDLHASGLCYRDVSQNNIQVNPVSGAVRICDNDNVWIDGVGDSPVVGTYRCAAPEVIRGQAQPSSNSDLYSMAVLLWEMLSQGHHPLHGALEKQIRIMDEGAERYLYAENPVFVFNPTNDSNRPIPGDHDNAIIYWNLYPQTIKDLFLRSFTDGIHDPEHGRVRESEWLAGLVLLSHSIHTCPNCGCENFHDDSVLGTGGATAITCWSCGGGLPRPIRLRVGSRTLVLDVGSKLFPYSIGRDTYSESAAPVADVVQHPSQASLFGLHNVSDFAWRILLPGGRSHLLGPGQSVGLEHGLAIEIAHVQGTVLAQ